MSTLRDKTKCARCGLYQEFVIPDEEPCCPAGHDWVVPLSAIAEALDGIVCPYGEVWHAIDGEQDVWGEAITAVRAVLDTNQLREHTESAIAEPKSRSRIV